MVNDRALAGALLLAVPLAISLPAKAAESEEAMRADVFVVTPRIWYGTYVSPKEADSEQVQESFRVPMAGATLTYAPKAAPNLALLATALSGDGQGTVIDQNFGVGTTSSKRSDFEILARYNLLGPKLYLLGGWRRVKFSIDDNVDVFSSTTDVSVSGPELGVGSTNDLSRDARHQVFGNFILLFSRYRHDYRDNFGFTENRSFRALGLDLNLGYQFWVTPAFNLSARYRMFNFYYEGTVGGMTYKDLAVFHGPEIGASIAF